MREIPIRKKNEEGKDSMYLFQSFAYSAVWKKSIIAIVAEDKHICWYFSLSHFSTFLNKTICLEAFKLLYSFFPSALLHLLLFYIFILAFVLIFCNIFPFVEFSQKLKVEVLIWKVTNKTMKKRTWFDVKRKMGKLF